MKRLDEKANEVSGLTAKLEAILARCEAATPGPWTFDQCGYVYYIKPMETTEYVDGMPVNVKIVASISSAPNNPDTDFIAHARTDLPFVVNALKEVMEASAKVIGEAKMTVDLDVDFSGSVISLALNFDTLKKLQTTLIEIEKLLSEEK